MELLQNLDPAAMGEWFRAEVLPHLVTVLTVLGVVLVEVIPAVRSLLRARGALAAAAERADAYTREKAAYDEKSAAREAAFEERMGAAGEALSALAEEMAERVRAYEGRLAESEARLSEMLLRVETSAARTERMVYLGMSNTGELVVNGAARRICEIEEEVESDDGREACTQA